MHRITTFPVALAPVALVSAIAFCTPAVAAVHHYQCTLAASSTLTQTSSLTAPLPGTFIGNYDATNNPTGTRTLPNLSGGSGNIAIAFTSNVVAQLSVPTTSPAGSFEMGFDPVTGQLSVNKLYMDALAGATGTISTNIVISFGNWHTVNPSSIYFGVSNLSIPVGTGQLTRADATQNGDSVGMAKSTGAGTWSFAITVPVDLMTEGQILGQPFGGDPIVGALAFTGTITQVGNNIQVSVDASANETQPVPSLGTLVNQPFDMPTILPPGNTAHLLVNGTFGDGTATSNVTAHLVAPGVMIGILGDFNGDGIVNGADLGTLLGAWGTPEGDLNDDGTTNGADLGTLLGNWT